MKICVYNNRHPRAKHISNALYAGASAMGWDVESTRDEHYEPRGDILAAYGWINRPMFEAYKAAGAHFLYVDLGYWGRRGNQGDYGGYHKVILDGRHPNEYFQRNRSSDRLDEGAPKIEDWELGGSHIVLAGLSGKGAISLGLEPFEWERNEINKIRRFTSRPIVYRPKPGWSGAKPIEGVGYSNGNETIQDALIGAHLLVTNYSNAAIDALAFGIPVIAEDGAARVMNEKFEDIENPKREGDRLQFLSDVSYCHWKKSEISDGSMFRQFVDDGLILC